MCFHSSRNADHPAWPGFDALSSIIGPLGESGQFCGLLDHSPRSTLMTQDFSPLFFSVNSVVRK
jgi:hypothetical protein